MHLSQPHLRRRRRVAVAPSPPLVPHSPQHTHPEKPPRPSSHVPPLPPLPRPLPPVCLQWVTPCGPVWPSKGRPLGRAVLPI